MAAGAKYHGDQITPLPFEVWNGDEDPGDVDPDNRWVWILKYREANDLQDWDDWVTYIIDTAEDWGYGKHDYSTALIFWLTD
jgi:hypothetical protein